jgi:hypothetical protein
MAGPFKMLVIALLPSFIRTAAAYNFEAAYSNEGKRHRGAASALSAVPTPQPSSRGQDEGSCGFLMINEDAIFMRPHASDSMARAGGWEDDSGAQRLIWKQDQFAWEYETIYFYVDSKLFLKAEVIENEEVQLPTVRLNNARRHDKEHKVVTIALKDCNDVLLYILREHTGKSHDYEISDRNDELLATSEMGTLDVDQIHWYDTERKPIAIAQSPVVIPGVHRHIDNQADPHFGNVPSWEVMFLSGYNSSSSLLIPEKRFTILAAVQERAIRNAMRGPDGEVEPSAAFPWFVGLFCLGIFVCIAACFGFLHWVYRLVYPKTFREVENKFLQPDKKIYGSLIQKQNYGRQ